MTLSTIERTLLKEKLVYIHAKAQYIYQDNLPATTTLSPVNVNTLLDRRDHIMAKLDELISVIEQ
jgi:hypothetical protein